MRNRLTLLASLAVLGFSFAAHADTVITGIGVNIIANGGTAPGSATNYDFFGSGAAAVTTNFSVSTGGSNVFSGGSCCGYTTITVPGGTTPVITGIAYPNGDSNGTPVLFATFSPDASGDFTVFVLDANSDANDLRNISVSLGVNGGTPVALTTCGAGSSCNSQRTNEFSEFSITGATSSDVFDVYATSNGERPSIGGLTFGGAFVSAVPEPSSIALLGTGVLTLAGAARRKFLKA